MKKTITTIKPMFVSIVLSLSISSLVCVNKKSHKDQNIRATLTYQDFKNNRFNRLKKDVKRAKNQKLTELRSEDGVPMDSIPFPIVADSNIANSSFTNTLRVLVMTGIISQCGYMIAITNAVDKFIKDGQNAQMLFDTQGEKLIQENKNALVKMIHQMAIQLYVKNIDKNIAMSALIKAFPENLSWKQKEFVGKFIETVVQEVKSTYQAK